MQKIINDDLFEICVQLYSEGKEPSSALIKYRYGKPVQFKEIIDAIQHWKKLPKSEKSALSDKYLAEHQRATNTINVSTEATNNSTTSKSEASISVDYISDDAFLDLGDSKKLLYLKHLLEDIHTKLSKSE